MEDEDGNGHYWGFNWLALWLYKKKPYIVYFYETIDLLMKAFKKVNLFVLFGCLIKRDNFFGFV
jgi:hypothetical protein